MKIDYDTLFCLVDDFLEDLSLGIKGNSFRMEPPREIEIVIST